jgi:hypothetical protein
MISAKASAAKEAMQKAFSGASAAAGTGNQAAGSSSGSAGAFSSAIGAESKYGSPVEDSDEPAYGGSFSSGAASSADAESGFGGIRRLLGYHAEAGFHSISVRKRKISRRLPGTSGARSGAGY